MAANPSPLPTPDRDYRIAEADRARIAADFDINALETLLQHSPPSWRASIIESFVMSRTISTDIGPDGMHREHLSDQTMLTRISDPALQEMLDAVWASRFAKKSLKELETLPSNLPGVEAAKRLARQRSNVK